MFQFEKLIGFLYAGDFLFLASLATIIIKLQLEKSSLGFSAKTQGVYGVVLCTRNIDLLFVEGSSFYLIYSIFKKITNISCIIYIVFKIKSTSKNNTTCNCNQDSFWVEALVLPCIIITAIFHYGNAPEEVLWSFSTYLEAVAMVPQLYLIQVRGKGDSYLTAYVSLMATYTFTDALAYCLNSFIYEHMPAVWPGCKCLQLSIYIWYIFIPREAVMPVANCTERKRKTTVFMRQQSMLAQTLLTKNNSSNDLKVFSITSPTASPAPSRRCVSSEVSLFEGGLDTSSVAENKTLPDKSCIKFDIGLDSESIRLKAPISLNTIKQLKNKGSLKLSSLPSTPEFSRKSALLRSTSTMDFFRPKNDFMQFDTALSQRAKRMKKAGISLPNTPESEVPPPLFLSPTAITINRSISQIHGSLSSYKNRKIQYSSNSSLQNTPELERKSELLLRVPSLSSKSLSHLPLSYDKPKKFILHPTLPRIEGSPAYNKKLDPINSDKSPNRKDIVPLSKAETHPQNMLSNKEILNDLNLNLNFHKIEDDFIPLESVHTPPLMRKPKRPVLPKLIISAPETGYT